MLPLRLFLCLMLVAIVAYTGVVMSHHGIDFLPVFFGDMARMNWAGQFNLDFLGLLLLSALWVAWRQRFSAGGIALAMLALFGGTPFLCAYLLIAGWRSDRDVRALLLGPRQHDR
ncbi:MAG TPA: hypothetical protein PLA97_15890 [Rubrivivax sp.]|nr:hypothetical protein [Rubrivivax sp.]